MSTKISTLDDLNHTFDENEKIIVNFYAKDCAESKLMEPYFEKSASDPHNVGIAFLRVDVEELGSVQDRYGIKTVPTFLALQSRELVGQCQGVAPERLEKIIADLIVV
ncbi:hypothetical protein BGZ99_008094 [Dissophora globulifera]|uniref:Thioredoxin domain-containing protein n=1 Tax=Dissophora globulifera TaxID=979702 RepID=A0A9P6UZ50_9FUNG|nr:hypothetical protein BGZ99_008094 [Dissophora globulifera]